MITLTIDGDRAELHGSTKGDADEARVIVRPWVWSRSAGAYVLPRSLKPQTRAYWVSRTAQGLRELGREVEVNDSGERLTESERREARTERLEIRADRLEGAAERNGAEGERRWDAGRKILDGIPMGQPVLVGHHSEGRHRRDLKRADDHMRKGIELEKVAQDQARRAENLRRALDNPEDLGVVRRRIERNAADMRRLERTIEDHEVAQRIAGTPLARKVAHVVREVSPGRLASITAERDRLAEAIELDRDTLKAREEAGDHAWNRADFRKGDKVVGPWADGVVSRVNAKSLTVPHPFMSGHTVTVGYDEVTGRVRDGVAWDGKGADPCAEASGSGDRGKGEPEAKPEPDREAVLAARVRELEKIARVIDASGWGGDPKPEDPTPEAVACDEPACSWCGSSDDPQWDARSERDADGNVTVVPTGRLVCRMRGGAYTACRAAWLVGKSPEDFRREQAERLATASV